MCWYALPFAAICCYLLLVAAICCHFLLFAIICCYLLPFADICCNLLLFAAVCCSLMLLAAICYCLLLFAPKSVPVGSQNDHLGTQNDSKMVKKSTKIGSWGPLGTPPGQLNPNFQSQGPFLTIFGSPLGSQNQPKINPWPKKWSQGSIFNQLLLPTAFLSIFWLVLACFLLKKTTKNTRILLELSELFWNTRPSQNTVFYRSGAMFSVFEFLWFLSKIVEKMTVK